MSFKCIGAVLTASVVLECFVSTMEIDRYLENNFKDLEPGFSTGPHLADGNHRNERSVHVSAGRNFLGRNARNIITKLLPLKYRIPVFAGAKLVKLRGRTRYWEKLGGKEQFEKDLAKLYRSENQAKSVETFNGMGGAGEPYSLRLESKNLRGQRTVEVITYVRKW